MKKIFFVIISTTLLLSGCNSNAQGTEPKETESRFSEEIGVSEEDNTSTEIDTDTSSEEKTETETESTVETETIENTENANNTENTETIEPTEEEEESETTETTSSSENSQQPENSETEQEPVEPEVPEYTFEEYAEAKTMYAKSSVNVRDLPEKSGKKLGSLSLNDEVKVLAKCNETGWYKIEYKNGVAYVSNNYLVSEKIEEEKEEPEDTSKEDNGSEDEEYVVDTELERTEPEFGDARLTAHNSGINVSNNQGWHYERGTKYYVWTVNEAGEGFWEAKYEGFEENKRTVEELAPFIDEAYGQTLNAPTWKTGEYVGEEYRGHGFDVWIYLGDGKVEE